MQTELQRCNNAYVCDVTWTNPALPPPLPLFSSSESWKNGEATRQYVARRSPSSGGRNWSPMDRRCARLILFRVHLAEKNARDLSWGNSLSLYAVDPYCCCYFEGASICIPLNKFKKPRIHNYFKLTLYFLLCLWIPRSRWNVKSNLRRVKWI